MHLKNGCFWQHFLTANINALLVLILAHAGQPTGRIFGSTLHFAWFSVRNLAHAGSINVFRTEQHVLTEQVTAGDASLSDGGLHGTDRRWEDVRLLENLR